MKKIIPEHFSVTGGLWEHKGKWKEFLNSEDFWEVFELEATAEEIGVIIHYEKSEVSKEETEKVLEMLLKAECIQQLFKRVKELVKEAEQIKAQENLPFALKTYDINTNGIETITFHLFNSKITCLLQILRNEEEGVYGYIEHKEDTRLHIDEAFLFPRQKVHNLLKRIRNHPKARLRSLLHGKEEQRR